MKRYEELASVKGQPEPLDYLFKQFKKAVIAGNEVKAEELAKFLVPYGHGKQAPVDLAGETVVSNVLVFD